MSEHSHEESEHDHDHGTGHHDGHGHSHEDDHAEGGPHGHSHALGGGKRGLLIALSITVIMMVVEIVGGILSNSLALLSDAGHMFTDTMALALSFFAMKFAEMPATEKKTYGFYRMEILAALLNGATLVLISLYIIFEAYQRILHPQPVAGKLMLVVAIIGLIANILGALFLVKHHDTNLNIRGAFLHIIGDAISSVGVIVGGIVISYTGWYLVDPILSILIAVGIIIGAFGLVRESVNILLESVPSHLDVATIAAEIGKIKGVKEAYHIHVWTITSGVYALSSHVVIDDQPVSNSRSLLNAIHQLLADRFKIAHSTIQLECERCDEQGICSLPVAARNNH
ncbi:MAG: cation diffusion facilitator family transporter [Nitrospiraceae bacterium]|nr:cation diffusion facilitator family transporter [Nitrospiraceae bacterium]